MWQKETGKGDDMSDDIREMELADYGILQNIKASLYRLWKLKLIPFLSAGIGVLLAVAFLVYSGEENSYFASASIFSAVYGSYSETVSGVSVMNNYSSLLGTTRVCNRAVAEINKSDISAEYLVAQVKAGNIYLSGLKSKSYGYKLDLCVRMEDPYYTVDVTNAMARAFASEINELLGSDVVQVFDEATYVRVIPKISKLLVIGLLAGAAFVLACAIIVIKEFFSSKVYVVSQCEADKDNILGIIPYNR